MDQITQIYNQFLSYFPSSLHPLISIILALLLVYGIIKVLQRNFIYIILLVVLLPASIPILKNVWDSATGLILFLVGRK